MQIRIFDLECDALLDNAQKIYCLSYCDIPTQESKTITDYEQIKEVFKEEGVIWAGHNIARFDFPVLKKILGIETPKWCIDTLGLSWYLFPEEKKHGLEEWGEKLGIKKPVIEDWGEGNIENIVIRCEEDVKINVALLNKFLKTLDAMYSKERLQEFLEYIWFKLDCVREQEEIGLKLDVKRCEELIEQWEKDKETKIRELEEVMPQIPIYRTKTIPKAITKKDGTFSKQGELWYELMKEEGGEEEEVKEIKILKGYKAPNANSHDQIKEWLYSLGWNPGHIKHVRDKKKNTTKQIPQIASKEGGGDICHSIKELFEKEPKLALLEGLSVISHRIALIKGFMKDQKEGRIFPSMAGLTNTLRLKHKTVVNLPAVEKKYGEEVRGLLLADEEHLLCGSDLANIEDRTKRHYIYKYDPQYVEDMNVPGYDAHLEIAVLAGFMGQEDVDFYKQLEERKKNGYEPSKEEKERFSKLKAIRNKSKITNFSATYKIGADALSRNANIPLKEAKKLLLIYWERNNAILKVEKSCMTMEAGGKRWLLNPISGFWYSLRADKDKFSTLNQGTAVYCFDVWLKYIREQGVKVAMQYHDEILFNILKDNRLETENKIKCAIEKTNEQLQLNVPVGCSVQFGDNYANVH